MELNCIFICPIKIRDSFSIFLLFFLPILKFGCHWNFPDIERKILEVNYFIFLGNLHYSADIIRVNLKASLTYHCFSWFDIFVDLRQKRIKEKDKLLSYVPILVWGRGKKNNWIVRLIYAALNHLRAKRCR